MAKKTQKKIKKVRPKHHRRMVTCWILWTFHEGGGGVVQLLYWRRVIYYVDLEPLKGLNGESRWWAAQEKCKQWAISQGFEVLKEKLFK